MHELLGKIDVEAADLGAEEIMEDWVMSFWARPRACFPRVKLEFQFLGVESAVFPSSEN